MLKAVRNEHGTFTYESTTLEEFVEQLAREWQMPLGDLTPTQTWTTGLFLERKGNREETVHTSNIWYTRNPSEEFREKAFERRNAENYVGANATDLYADKRPSLQYAHLRRDKKRVVMKLDNEGHIQVNVQIRDVIDALTETMRELTVRNIKPDEAGVILNFRGTAPPKYVAEPTPVHLTTPNQEGDMVNAFLFVVNYFKK